MQSSRVSSLLTAQTGRSIGAGEEPALRPIGCIELLNALSLPTTLTR